MIWLLWIVGGYVSGCMVTAIVALLLLSGRCVFDGTVPDQSDLGKAVKYTLFSWVGTLLIVIIIVLMLVVSVKERLGGR